MKANASVTLQAVQRLGQPVGNGNGNGKGNANNNAEGNGDNTGVVPMNLATFRKVYPPTFRGSTNFTKVNHWFQEMELMQLKQGSISVAEYTKFQELCRFSRVCQGDSKTFESWRCIKYQRGLMESIMAAVAPMEIRVFSDLVNKARVMKEYAKTVVVSKDTHGGSSSRGRGKYFHPRGLQKEQSESVSVC
ncbi:hypothetical protein AHAS_Ahas19G0177900 [Arachis hypogaea]